MIDTALSEIQSFEDTLFKIITNSYANGRHIILLTNRINLLVNLYRRMIHLDCGVVFSHNHKEYRDLAVERRMPAKEFQEWSLQRRIILGIEQIAKTGMDVARADTLILENPMTDIQQAVGRIDREHAEKLPMLVYYLFPDMGIYKKRYYGTSKEKGAVDMFRSLGHICLPEIKASKIKKYLKIF